MKGLDQWIEREPRKDDLRELDPYGHLVYVIGSPDDFICFDWVVDYDNDIVIIKSVLNSETGHFIQDFYPQQSIIIDKAIETMQNCVDDAVSWCIENEVVHDASGWDCSPNKIMTHFRATIDGD